MPEGPEIRRAADRLADVLQGRRLQRVFFGLDSLRGWEARLTGCRVTRVEACGKALLTHFDNDLVMYTHNQLYGRWEIVEGDQWPDSPRRLRVALHTPKHAALLYSASDIEILKCGDLATHRYLAKLGLELLGSPVDALQVYQRLAEPRYRRRALMRLLQDQSVLAGMGNYLCCEALHVAGVHPRQRPMDLSSERLRTLATAFLQLTRQSHATGGITNKRQRAHAMMRAGASFEEARFHVYRRNGRPCYRCGAPVVQERIGRQVVYLCPRCQPANAA